MNTDANLHEKIIILENILEEKNSIIEEKDTRISQLEALIKSLRQKQFSPSSEKLNADQLALFNEAEVISESEEEKIDQNKVVVAEHTRQKKPRVSIPADLPREEIVYDLPEEEKVCPHHNIALKLIDQLPHEQLDIIPAQIKVIRHLRNKYACPCCDGYIKVAEKPKQIIEKSIASPGLVAHVVTQKFVDGMPLYRQSESLKRQNIFLDRTNLANWTIKYGCDMQPLINLMLERIRQQNVLHIDETTVQVLCEPGRSAQSKSYMWVMASFNQQPATVFYYAPSRSSEIAQQLLADSQAAFMADGYPGYNALEQTHKRLGCWAHARRKFIEAQKLQPKGKVGKADQALSYIQKLYAIERNIKDHPIDEKYRIRQLESKPIIDKIQEWMQKSLAQISHQSEIGKALNYLNNQWPSLVRYLDNGEYPIDNNLIENAIRPFAIGRKNWLFAQSQAGARASANLYSLIETAKLNKLNPYEYLRKVFTEIPSAQSLEDIEALLPWNIKL
jgi:transposase